jgi:hypothetical protein
MLGPSLNAWDKEKSRLAYRHKIHKSTWRKRGTLAAAGARDATIVLPFAIR